ncbi:glycosyltransferase (plasmid) [Haloferacaceae archaeon DSL9]
MDHTVVAFTDVYLPRINGVTYTVMLWREQWNARHGRMPLVYPAMEGYNPGTDEFPVKSVPAPLYSDYRLGIPKIPDDVADPDLIHLHTPFSIGVAGLRFAHQTETPVVASYHTLLGERSDYVAPSSRLSAGLRRACHYYERWFFEAVDLVTTPTTFTRRYLEEFVGVDADIEIISNGVDTDVFRPVDSSDFRAAYDIPNDRPIVGYTGRHSEEKELPGLIDAVEGMDVTLVLGGDGPTSESLRARAAARDLDVRFLGFIPRDELPAFYSMLDVFAFPSPLETQGLVALEAVACGTPVVAVDAGALSETIVDDETGVHYPFGDDDAFREAIRYCLDNRERLRSSCLARRKTISVEHSIDQLAAAYADLLDS